MKITPPEARFSTFCKSSRLSAQRHSGEDQDILDARHALYQRARQKNPARWSGQTRNWTPVDAVTLNPERDSVIKAAVADAHIHAAAA